MKPRMKLWGIGLGFIALVSIAAGADAQPQPNLKSWSRKIPNAKQRFQVLSSFDDEAVLDQETGLVWQRVPGPTKRNWRTSLGACHGARTGGRGGWHLPKMEALTSLIDPDESNPPLPQGHPFDLSHITGDVWSATTVPNTDTANTQDVIHDGFLGGFAKTSLLQSWCVRGGQSIDGQ